MREINNISDADLKAMESLDKNCLDLHLFPPPKTFIQMEVEGPDGTKVESRKMRSQSWHRNAYNMIMQAVTAAKPANISSQYGAGSLQIRAVNGENYSSAGIGVDSAVPGPGDTTTGIVVGGSNSPENFNDTAAVCLMPNGTSLKVTNASRFSSDCTLEPRSVSYNATGEYIFATHASSAPFFAAYESETMGQVLFAGGPAGGVYSCHNSPCGNYVAMALADGTSKIYKIDLVAKTLTMVFSANFSSYGDKDGVRWSPNGNFVCFTTGNATNNTLLVKNNRDDSFAQFSPAIGSPQGACAWSNDNNYLAFALLGGPWCKIFRNNNDGTLTEVFAMTGLTAFPKSPKWSPDGKYLVFIVGTSPYFSFIKKTGVDSFEKISPTIAGVSRYFVSFDFSVDGKYIIFPTDVYCKAKLLEIKGDDTFVLVSDQTEMLRNHYYSEIGCLSRHPSKNEFAVSTGWVKPYVGVMAIVPALNYATQIPATAKYFADTRKMAITIKRTMNNNTETPASVGEMVLYSRTIGNSQFLLSRDVLAEPLIVPPAYKLTVTYTMEMTFPA